MKVKQESEKAGIKLNVHLGAVIAWFQSVDTISELSGIVEYFKMQVY